MQSAQDPRRDGFDVAKMQKSLKQQRQVSLRQRDSITKLSPSEIRSLNISIAASKTMRASSPTRRQRANTNTPPRTPENASAPRRSPSGRTNVNLPTPPHSPEDPTPKRHNSTPGNGGQIHSPTPRSHSKAGFVLPVANPRPQSASSHRGMPTYRGPELTKTGSVSMLHSAVRTNQIVDNPLSQFSRPRLPRGSVSPTRQDRRRSTQTDHDDANSIRSQSLPIIPIPPSRTVTPPSMIRSAVPPTNKTLEPALVVEVKEPTEAYVSRVQTAAVDGPITTAPHSRFSWGWRRGLASRNKGLDNGPDINEAKPIGLPWSKGFSKPVQSVAYEKTAPGIVPENRVTLKGDLPSSKTSLPEDDKISLPSSTTEFAAHPAVRPLGAQPEHLVDVKGKGKAREDSDVMVVHHNLFSDDKIPMYSRCPCCSRLKKPDGNRSLSPVLENENLRTNLSMEIERTDNLASGREQSSSADRQRYMPIIPMIVAPGNTVQAKIAPKLFTVAERPQEQTPTGPVVNSRGDIIASGSEPIALVPKQLEDKGRKFVRFTSLHFKNELEKQANIGERVSTELSRPRRIETISEVPTLQLNFEVTESKHNPSGISSIPEHPIDESQIPVTSSEEITGELMAAINGIGATFGGNEFNFGTENDVQTLEDFRNMTPTPPIEFIKETETLPGIALTTADEVSQVSSQQSSDGSAPVSRTVSFEPLPAGHERIATPPAPTTAARKSALKRRPESYQTPESNYATYYSDPSKGITTKPKATAQFMFSGNSNENSTNHAPIDYTAANSGYRVPTNRSSSQRSSMIISSARSSIASSSGTSSRSSRPQSFIEHGSRSFDGLPSPHLGRSPAGSTTSLDKFGLPGRKRRTLAESVLAATTGQRGSTNTMLKPKQ